jgi:hypothetical protein
MAWPIVLAAEHGRVLADRAGRWPMAWPLSLAVCWPIMLAADRGR